MGNHALDDAEKLTSSVEELLGNRQAAENSENAPVTSGAAPAESGPRP